MDKSTNTLAEVVARVRAGFERRKCSACVWAVRKTSSGRQIGNGVPANAGELIHRNRTARRRVQSFGRNHLLWLRRTAPLQHHRRIAGSFPVLQLNVVAATSNQIDGFGFVGHAAGLELIHQQLPVHPQPRAVVGVDDEAVCLSELSFNLPCPSGGKSVAADGRVRRTRSPIKIDVAILASHRGSSQIGRIEVLAQQASAGRGRA